MKIVLRIAWLEFRGFFYSPVAWLVLVAFIIPPGIAFGDMLENLQRQQYLGQKMSDLTRTFFTAPYFGFFPQVQTYLYLFLPLLTMGLFSRELASGSIKLLYSSPVQARQIVLGKYVALMGYGLVLVGILGLFAGMAGFAIESMDVPFVLCGLLGLYLLICAYAAIGLFMSCLTSYQVVAAASTLAALFALNYIGKVGQQFDFVRDLTYFLSLAGRTGSFVDGLIRSKDLAYFLIVIAMFLGFCIVKLRSGRESIPAVTRILRYVAVLAAALVAGYVTSRPALWLDRDFSATQSRTLSVASQAVMKRFDGPVQMSTYVNLLDQRFYSVSPSNRNNDLSRFDTFLRFKPDVTTDYVYYYDTSRNERLYRANLGLNDQQLAQRTATSSGLVLDRFLTPEQIRRQIDLGPEENRVVRQLAFGGRTSYLRMFDDQVVYPMESEITAAFKRLVVTPPRVAFLTGHGERRLDRAADEDYQSTTKKLPYRYSLVNQGFDVGTLELKGQAVPADVTVLVIANPKQELGGDTSAVRDYLARGGNLLITADPGDQSVLNPLLESLGVQFQTQPLTQSANKDLPPDFIVGKLAAGMDLFDQNTQVRLLLPVYGRGIFGVKAVSLPGCLGLDVEKDRGFALHPVLVADETPVALGLTRAVGGKQQRMLVIGDADFMSNQEVARTNVEAANLSFTLEAFKWLGGGEFPVDTNHPETKDNSVLVDRAEIFRIKVLFLGCLPALILAAGTTLLVRRRSR
ncbi:MAG TPA: Gldg family protein [Lacunisphaera sp.]|nr:Gldg family protein [Lacunisphaera sp.]